MSKGSKRRPSSVARQEFDRRFNDTFGVKCPVCLERIRDPEAHNHPEPEPRPDNPEAVWFPKPPNCTCTYDAGWIYDDPECPAHAGLAPYRRD